MQKIRLETSINCHLKQDLRAYPVPSNRINSKQINKIFGFLPEAQRSDIIQGHED